MSGKEIIEIDWNNKREIASDAANRLKMEEVFLNNWPTALTVTAASPFSLCIREHANSKVLEFLEIEPSAYTK